MKANMTAILTSLKPIFVPTVLFSPSREAKSSRLKNLTVPYTAISAPRQSAFRACDLFGKDPALYFGYDEFGHTYLVAGKCRIEGNPLYWPGTRSPTDILSSGVVVRVPVSQQELEHSQTIIAQHATRDISCTLIHCRLATKIGVDLSPGIFKRFYTPSILKRILSGEVENSAGERLPIEANVIGFDSLESYFKVMVPRHNRRMIGYTSLGLAVLIGFAILIYSSLGY